MTREEAIVLLGEQKYFLTKNVYKSTNETDREWKLTKALDMAIEALEQERPEIIRCENCRHDNNCEIQFDAQAGSKFFCGSAERREK